MIIKKQTLEITGCVYRSSEQGKDLVLKRFVASSHTDA